MNGMLRAVFEPGFFTNTTVQAALGVGAATALVTGVVGVFTVLRRQSFAAHTLGELGATGGSVALFAGTNPLWGFVGIALLAAGLIELLGTHRPKARDLATGLVLGAGLGVAALFLYLDATSGAGAPTSILFGSLFVVSSGSLPAVVALAAVSLLLVAVSYRSMLLSSLSPDLALARGGRTPLVTLAYLTVLSLAVAMAAQTIGAVLATALLVGPPAAALRITGRPGRALAAAAGIGVLCVWVGVLLSYDSYYWPPRGHGWPVSFFVVAAVFACYLLSGLGRAAPRTAG